MFRPGLRSIFSGGSGNFTRDPNRCQPEKSLATSPRLRDHVRAVVVSHLYADPANRAKLRALAGLGVALTAIVPDRWTTSDGVSQSTGAGDDAGVTVTPVPVSGPSTDPARLQWNGAGLRRVINDFRPDLVHVEEEPWSQPAALSLRAARRLGVPGVLSTAESLPRSYTLGQRFRRERSLRLAAGVIGSNNLALALAIKRRPTVPHLSLPHLGVTPPGLTPRVPHTGLAIGFVGRLVPERGLDLLFRACVGLAGKWTVTVVGTGPSQEELEGLAQRLGIAARISWVGALPRAAVDEIWPQLDCVVLPSRTTQRWVMTVGRAAIHAMAHGVAVVGTDSGALRELVGHGGRIVPEEDVPSLTTVLQELYADRSLCERLGAAGRRRVMEEFSDAALAGKMLAFWRTLIPATA
jgi:glycosyltransferase involved in cell wall biosynthesis